MTKKNLPVLLALASLPLFGGCAGNSDEADTDDSGTKLAFEATIRVTLPTDAPTDTRVSIGGIESGWAAVVECGGTECEDFAALEPDTFLVRVEATGYYFSELSVLIDTDGQLEEVSWERGGCADPEWSVGDGQCSSWTNGQYGCDLTGFWKGIEDPDQRGDLAMEIGDENQDGLYEALVVGGYDSEDLVGVVIPPLNISGTTMNLADPSLGWRYAQLVEDAETNAPANCDATVIRFVDESGEFHMELYEE